MKTKWSAKIPKTILLHDEDTVYCNKCQKAWSGKTIAKMLEKKASEGEYAECPCCKGTGRAKKERRTESKN